MLQSSDTPVPIWHASWEVPAESLFSGLLKLSLANTLGAKELLSRVFGCRLSRGESLPTHKRSLLDTDWTRAYAPRDCHPYILDLCAQSQLPGARLLRQMGTDAHIRYCAQCLSMGMHFPEFQIEGLHFCPIHSSPLTVNCEHCGHLTARYAITDAIFFSPYKCFVCGNYLSRRFDVDCLGQDQNPLSQSIAHPLRPLTKWLTSIAATPLRWAHSHAWALPEVALSPNEERRKIYFLTALAFKPWPCIVRLEANQRGTRWQTLDVGLPVPISHLIGAERSGDESARERVQIYKSIRRHVFKRYINKHRGCACSPVEYGDDVKFSGRDIPDARICLWVQAWMLWRSRFENNFHDAPFRSGRTTSERWQYLYKSDVWDARMSDHEWTTLLWFSFHAAFKTVVGWMSTRWHLLFQGLTTLNSVEFRSVDHPYAHLFLVSEQPEELYTTIIEVSIPGQLPKRYMVGIDVRDDMTRLFGSCNPLFPTT